MLRNKESGCAHAVLAAQPAAGFGPGSIGGQTQPQLTAYVTAGQAQLLLCKKGKKRR
jgi:hypothetical protein